jgi:DMSO/TMAO reductase YedYZ molybdopterin-dependent catalytic subunit
MPSDEGVPEAPDGVEAPVGLNGPDETLEPAGPGEPIELGRESPPPEGEAPRRLRFTRRRLLILGGAAAAGVAATLAGVRAWSGSGEAPAGSPAASPSADALADFPVLSVEPPPDVPAKDWVLKVDGLVERPLTVDRATWSGLKRLDETADFNCVTGWTLDNVRWGGVAPSVLLDQAGVRPEATHAAFHAVGHAGAEYLSSLPLDLVLAPDTVLADTLDGAALPPKHGGPLRLVVPQQLGYKNVKWVVRIEITDKLVPGYWEQRGYPENAPVRG